MKNEQTEFITLSLSKEAVALVSKQGYIASQKAAASFRDHR